MLLWRSPLLRLSNALLAVFWAVMLLPGLGVIGGYISPHTIRYFVTGAFLIVIVSGIIRTFPGWQAWAFSLSFFFYNYHLDSMWPWRWVGPIAVFLLVVSLGEKRFFLPRPVSPVRLSEVPARIVEGILLGAISCAVLELFFRSSPIVLEVDLSHLSFEMKLANGLGFSALNALLEESIWRIILLGTLIASTGRKWEANIIQAFTFGLAHIAGGIPQGVMGGVLAMGFGILMGALVLYRRSGLFAALIAHFVVDFYIFSKAVFQLQIF